MYMWYKLDVDFENLSDLLVMDMDTKIPPMPPAYKKRHILVTVILTVLGFGLPLIYCGYLKAGLLIEVGTMIFIFMLFVLEGVVPTLPTTILLFSAFILLFVSLLIINIRFTLISNRLQKPRLRYAWLWIVGVIMVTGTVDYVGVSIIESNVVEAYKIPASSMEPTMLVGDYLMATKGIDPEELQYGDIIIFKYPFNQNQNYIKRLIAKEGDTIDIIDKEIYRNGEKLIEPYTKHMDSVIIPYYDNGRWGQYRRDNMPEIEIPPGRLFVLGDNRDNSADSRFWGFLDEDLVIGRARFIDFSWDSENNRIRWERMGKRLD